MMPRDESDDSPLQGYEQAHENRGAAGGRPGGPAGYFEMQGDVCDEGGQCVR